MLRCPRCRISLQRETSPIGVFWRCASCEGRLFALAVLRKQLEASYVNRLWRSTREVASLVLDERKLPARAREILAIGRVEERRRDYEREELLLGAPPTDIWTAVVTLFGVPVEVDRGPLSRTPWVRVPAIAGMAAASLLAWHAFPDRIFKQMNGEGSVSGLAHAGGIVVGGRACAGRNGSRLNPDHRKVGIPGDECHHRSKPLGLGAAA